MRGVIRYCLKLVLPALTMGFMSTPVMAADVMYWILCNCQPDNSADASFEISNQVSPYSYYGGSGGFEPGDVVVLQNGSASPSQARWTRQANGTWVDTSGSGYVCSGFDACVDLTGGLLPQPPWEIPSVPPAPNNVAANWTGNCTPNGKHSLYVVSWSPVSSATYYDVYRNYGVGWTVAATTSGTAANVTISLKGLVKVKACNSLFGCGSDSTEVPVVNWCNVE